MSSYTEKYQARNRRLRLWAKKQKPLSSSFIIAILLLLLLLDGGCATNITQSDEN